MNKLDDSNEVYTLLEDFVGYLNPYMRYQVTQYFFYDRIREVWLFKNAIENEIMYIANLMN